MKIQDTSSPNFGSRKDGKTPRLLILHYTDTKTLAETLRLLQGAREASAHYVVDEDGSIYRLVDEKDRAWHAGVSCWEGEEDVNSASIGIEIQNPGHQNGYRTFPEKQIGAVTDLCREIIARHGIKPYHVLAHSDIAPARKKDPGELFPWKELSLQGIGLWPAVTDADRQAARNLSEETIKDLLSRYGYDARVKFPLLMAAFQRHFQPERFLAFDEYAPHDAETLARLVALVKRKEKQ
jgi:N-acetylmuramoyl-L-alanine amidase